MPERMRSWALSTSSLMPGSSLSSERVVIRPPTQGTESDQIGSPSAPGMAMMVQGAGAGSVWKAASMAATFMIWFSVAT
ncbi:hypothetical protein D3C87_1740170 [compost metagenome]